MEASPVSYPFDDSSMRSITSPQRRDTNPFSDALAEEAEQTTPFPDADQHDQQGEIFAACKDKSKPSPVSRATEGARAEPLSFGLPREAGMRLHLPHRGRSHRLCWSLRRQLRCSHGLKKVSAKRFPRLRLIRP
ncbi:unnamed protein product [Effrenium voratum]|nr:unnamed protein product [Effrenium voratum]